MDEETYASMPTSLTIREVRFTIDDPGCRSRQVIVATTLTNSREYSTTDIADLYHQRWHAELDIRAVKQSLGMDMIHCKSPAMSRKALWANLLGYNLVRKVAAQAASEHNLAPRQISFAGAKDTLEAFSELLYASADDRRNTAYHDLFVAVATHIVGDRPDRVEPRRLKRRYDKYQHLRMPRVQARAAAINGRQ
jgi:hypothetical protein